MNAAARKCLVWDLDNTLWDGICLEEEVELRPEALGVLEILDSRGILHSVASRGEADVARRQLEAFGLDQYFLSPRINWLPKPVNLVAIAEELGIGVDSLAFMDDDPFEREHMAFMRPEVLVLDAADLAVVPDLPAFKPEVVTPESARRRTFYREDVERQAAEAGHENRRDFLDSCRMSLTVRAPTGADVPRVRELMSRTHQLNTTGLLLDESRIRALLEQPEGTATSGISLVVAEFHDRFGAYGVVGVAIIEEDGPRCRLTYLAMSCRVLGRGVESAFLHTLLQLARHRGHSCIEAELRDTGRNGSMRTLFQMSGFVARSEANGDGTTVFTWESENKRRPPTWVGVQCESF